MTESPVSPCPPEIAEKRWTAFWARISKENLLAVGLYAEPITLLRDSIVAYYAGAYGAAMIACRAAIEAACYTALTSIPIGPGGYKFDWPVDLSGEIRRVDFEEVKNGVASRRIVSPDLLKQIDEVQRHGNFIAHVAPKSAAQLHGFSKSTPPPRRIRTWVSQAEVLAAIECAETAFLALFAWSRTQPVQSLGKS